jgi:hypothetical protein
VISGLYATISIVVSTVFESRVKYGFCRLGIGCGVGSDVRLAQRVAQKGNLGRLSEDSACARTVPGN